MFTEGTRGIPKGSPTPLRASASPREAAPIPLRRRARPLPTAQLPTAHPAWPVRPCCPPPRRPRRRPWGRFVVINKAPPAGDLPPPLHASHHKGLSMNRLHNLMTSRSPFPIRPSHRPEPPCFSLVNPEITTLFVVVPSPPNLRGPKVGTAPARPAASATPPYPRGSAPCAANGAQAAPTRCLAAYGPCGWGAVTVSLRRGGMHGGCSRNPR
jgi:hypothetical protein